MPNPSGPRGKDGAGAGGGNRGGKSSTRSKRQPAKANAKLADEPNNETNLEDYHFSEFFPHEELQNQRAAARRLHRKAERACGAAADAERAVAERQGLGPRAHEQDARLRRGYR